MEAAQVCDRLRGEETCPFHKGHKVSFLCITCGILVCLKCITSSEHAGHTFKEITSCLREPTDNLAKHITEIEKRLLKAVDKELSVIKNQRAQSVQKHTKGVEQINHQRQQAHLQIDKVQQAHLQIDTNADSKVVQWDESSQQVLDILDKHTKRLESLHHQLNEDRKECDEILKKGSNILKYDAGLEITKKMKMQRIPKAPTISELEYIKCDQNFDELLLKAMGDLKEVHSKPGMVEKSDKSQAISSEIVKQHQYQLIETISNTDNESPIFASITPIGKNSAWARERIYDERTEKYSFSNVLSLIDTRRNVIQQIKLDTNILMLDTHPVTRQLFSINDTDNYVRSVDTITGKTTKLVKCEISVSRLKVTHDNHVIVGRCSVARNKDPVCKYKLTGELVNKSHEKYRTNDIDYCPQTNRVAISVEKEGLTLLNPDLTVMKTFNRKTMDCESAIFDSRGNILVADYSNKEIIVLDGEHLNFLQKLEIEGITCPDHLKLYDNILWVSCQYPHKLICARIT